ncbi:MAG: class I SAM-dependent methyltransferase [Candidatus Dormiibacterota bacterium]
MSFRSWVNAGLAAQLGRPAGLRGRVVAILLNRSNAGLIARAAEAAAVQPGAVVADLGFGGGLGLSLLLDRVGAQGQVHGVELSTTMLSRAARRFRREVVAGRLHLHSASMTQLPLADRSLDGVITNNTLYFIPELDQAFRELARVLSLPGRAVVGIGDPQMMAEMPTTPYGFKIRPVEEVVSVASSAGLRLADHQRAGEGERAAHLLVFGHTS